MEVLPLIPEMRLLKVLGRATIFMWLLPNFAYNKWQPLMLRLEDEGRNIKYDLV